MVAKVHVDTDFAGDPDDACAMAMLLAMADVDVVGVTTTLEDVGRRASCARYMLDLMGRPDIAVAAGAESTLTGGVFTSTWGDRRHWPEAVPALRSLPGTALDLLASSIGQGAVVVAIGGFTNLAMLEVLRPGILRDVPVVAMSGWFGPPAAGLPQWGPEMDFNTTSTYARLRLSRALPISRLCRCR
jgi:purine nucleosidase